MENYSVLMSVYYKERAENLRLSIQSMIDQSVAPEQLVLVCDGPLTELLNEVIAEYESNYPQMFTVVRLDRNGGLGAALNYGLKFCRNEYVARMDSDDIAVRERVHLQLTALMNMPEISVIGGQIAEFCEDSDCVIGYRTVPTTEGGICAYMKRRNPMNHVTVMFRKSHILNVGGYHAFQGPGFEDYYLWVSLLVNGYQLQNINEVCCKVRVNYGQYARRGGYQYFQNAMCVEHLMLKHKLISKLEFIRNMIVWYGGAVLIPTKIRKLLFSKILRKKELVKTERKRVRI